MGGVMGILGAIAGAILGASIAQALGHPDMVVAAAIAGSFVGGALVSNVPRPTSPSAKHDGDPPPPR